MGSTVLILIAMQKCQKHIVTIRGFEEKKKTADLLIPSYHSRSQSWILSLDLLYICNWPLQPFSQDYGLTSHTTHVVILNFIREWRDLQFNVDSKRQIFEKLFFLFLFTLRIFARNLLRGNPRINIFFFHIMFWYLAWDTNLGFTSNKPTHYLLDCDDFKLLILLNY